METLTNKLRNVRMPTFINYIGGIGYLFSSLVVLVGIGAPALSFMQSLPREPVEVRRDIPSTSPASSPSANVNIAVAYPIAIAMGVLTIGILLFLPYKIGFYLAHVPRWLLYHASVTITAGTIFAAKTWYLLVAVSAIAVTTYQPDFDLANNYMALTLWFFAIAGWLFFSLQHLLAHVKHTAVSDIA